MQLSMLLAAQLAAWFLMMGGGFAIVKAGWLKSEDSTIVSALMVYLIVPCQILTAFNISYTDEIRDGFLLAVGAAVLIHVILIAATEILSRILHLNGVEKASIIYSNSGNMILPLVTAVLGPEWVIYGSAYMAVQSFMLWSHCLSMIEEEKRINLKKIFSSVIMFAIIGGLLIFLFRITLPTILRNAISQLAAMTGPSAMLVIGMMLAGVNWKEVFLNKRIVLVTFLSMIALPMLVALVLKYSGLASLNPNGRMILCISLMATTTPTASTIVQQAQLFNPKNEVYAGALNVTTTLTCIVSMPLIIMFYMLN